MPGCNQKWQRKRTAWIKKWKVEWQNLVKKRTKTTLV
jgi:hypothetical protein